MGIDPPAGGSALPERGGPPTSEPQLKHCAERRGENSKASGCGSRPRPRSQPRFPHARDQPGRSRGRRWLPDGAGTNPTGVQWATAAKPKRFPAETPQRDGVLAVQNDLGQSASPGVAASKPGTALPRTHCFTPHARGIGRAGNTEGHAEPRTRGDRPSDGKSCSSAVAITSSDCWLGRQRRPLPRVCGDGPRPTKSNSHAAHATPRVRGLTLLHHRTAPATVNNPAHAGVHPPERARAVKRPRPNPERTGINQTGRKAEKTLSPKSLNGDPPHRPHKWDETPTRNPSRS